jgi:hypothetical protein
VVARLHAKLEFLLLQNIQVFLWRFPTGTISAGRLGNVYNFLTIQRQVHQQFLLELCFFFV